MEFRRYLRLGSVSVLVLAGLCAGVLGVAYAQDRLSFMDEDAVEPPPETVLTPAEMEASAKEIIARMETEHKAVNKVLDKSKEERDVVKVLCLDDKSGQMESARTAANERWQSLVEAVAVQDHELATHAYTILVVLSDRMTQLSAEASQCIGVEAGFVGDSQISISIDPGIPKDPSGYPDNPINTVPPECVSCVL